MRHLKASLLAAMAATVPLASAGCADWVGMDQGMIVIEGAILAKNGTQGCTNTTTDPFVSGGVLDVAIAQTYTMGMVVRTNLPATVNTQILQQERLRSFNYPNYGNADSNTVLINQARVFYTDGDNGDYVAPLPTDEPNWLNIESPTRERRTQASTTVFNEQTSLGNNNVMFIPAITREESITIGELYEDDFNNNPNFAKSLVVNVTLDGTTSGGGFVQSPTFSYPITICRNCIIPQVVNCAADEELLPADNCALVGQDAPLTCQ